MEWQALPKEALPLLEKHQQQQQAEQKQHLQKISHLNYNMMRQSAHCAMIGVVEAEVA
jgi:hypothetical protein